MEQAQEQRVGIRPQGDRLANVSLVLGLDKRLHEAEVRAIYVFQAAALLTVRLCWCLLSERNVHQRRGLVSSCVKLVLQLSDTAMLQPTAIASLVLLQLTGAALLLPADVLHVPACTLCLCHQILVGHAVGSLPDWLQ
jgi:hypothetical protein